MSAKPTVAIIGRPNVGKSTFFNKVAGRRISIVENTPGVTRDRIYADAEWCGYAFTMIDTGGIELKSEDEMWKHIKNQAEVAVSVADVVLFIADGKAGVLPDDYAVASFLRNKGKPVVLAINKLDTGKDDAVYDFYKLGIEHTFGMSAEQSLGMGDVLDAVCASFKKQEALPPDDTIKIAVVGKPNAGKSSLVNKLLGYERCIVSPVAGTTRDAIDTEFTYNDRKFTLIDTAGIRRKARVEEDIEYYSVVRAINSIKRADIVLVVIDASEDLSEQDVRIAGMAHEEGKPTLIVMNKWDTIEKDTHTINRFNDKLKEDLKFMDYFIPIYISALTGQRVNTVIDKAMLAFDNSRRRIATGLLNDVVDDAIKANEPPTRFGKKLKIMYATEASVAPPVFVFFVNDAEIAHFSYRRYLENQLRKAFDFTGTPIKLVFNNKDEMGS